MGFMLLQILEETSEHLAGIFCNIPLFGCLLLLNNSLQDNDNELCIIVYVDCLLEKNLLQPIMALCSINRSFDWLKILQVRHC